MNQVKTIIDPKYFLLKCLSLYLFLLIIHPALSQEAIPDRLYAHTDKGFYIIGETLNFKVYILNETKSISELIHADLVSSVGEIVGEELLKIENNSASGSLEIPLALKTGVYLLRIYSAWNSNFIEDFNFYKSIPIFNDFENQSDPVQIHPPDNPVNDLRVKSENIERISLLNSHSIHPRDTIYLAFRLGNLHDGKHIPNLSVAVLDLELCGQQDTTYMQTWYHKSNRAAYMKTDITYQPEKSIHISGNISDLQSGMPISSSVLSIYDTKQFQFVRLRSKKGQFSFETPLFAGSRVLQIINMNPYQPASNLVNLERISELLPTEAAETLFTDNSRINQYIYYSKLRRKISELYRESFPDSIKYHKSYYLPFEPDKSYEMEKFQLLKNVEDFLREAVINTSSIRENDQRKIVLNNAETKKFFMKPPWFIVDGFFIFNDSLVFSIPFNQLERIDIFNTNQSILKYFDPIMIQGGVIAIYTRDGYLVDYSRNQPNTVRIQGLSVSNGQEGNPVDQFTTAMDKPDLNPVIYWAPNVLFDETNTARIKFPANDVSGKYLIHIEGMNAAGHPFTAQRIIQVLP